MSDLRTIFTGVAVVVAVISLLITLWDRRRLKHERIVRALQGEKEAVAYIAYHLTEEKWKLPNYRRKEIFSALIFAWIFESSDRARAMILRALGSIPKSHKQEFCAMLTAVNAQLEDYAKQYYSDRSNPIKPVQKYLDRLKKMKTALD